jgi:hypothetical protein
MIPLRRNRQLHGCSAKSILFLILVLLSCISRVLSGAVELSSRDNNSIDQVHPSYDEHPKIFEKKEHHRSQNFGIGIEEEEAIVLESVCNSAAGILKSSFRFTAVAIRRTGDTIAGVLSGTFKAIAGAFRLSADAFWVAAMRLAQPRAPDDRMPHLFDHAGRRLAKVLRAVANVFYGFSEACIMSGETTEALTIGLGQAVEDSFSSLEFLCSSFQKGLTFLLSTESIPNNNRMTVKEDEFHQQKRRAILHTEASKGQLKLPLPIIPAHLTAMDSRGHLSNKLPDTAADNTEREKVPPMVGKLDGMSNMTDFISENESDIEEEGTDDADDSTPSRPPLASSSWSTSFFSHGEKSGPNEGLPHHPLSSINVKAIFQTIARWERYFAIRPASELLSYLNDNMSVLLLVVHVFWGWIAGPWISPVGVGVGASLSGSGSGSKVPPTSSEDDVAVEIFQIGPQLLFGLIVIAVASSIEYKSQVRKLVVTLCLVGVVWLILMASDHVNMRILAARVAITAVNTQMQRRVARSSITPLPSTSYVAHSRDVFSTVGGISALLNNSDRKKGKKNGGGIQQDPPVDVSPLKERLKERLKETEGGQSAGEDVSNSTYEDASPLDFEVSVWMNVVMASMWSVERVGGVGSYISQTIQGLVNDELALVPPGIANIQLKRFTLGTQPPVVQAVKVHSKRASICIAPTEQPTRAGSGGQRRASREGGSGRLSGAVDEEEKEDTFQRVTTNALQTAMLDGDGREAGPDGKSVERTQWEAWQSEWDRRHVRPPPASFSSSPSSSPSPSSSSTESHDKQPIRSQTHRSSSRSGVSAISKRPGGGNGCERLVMDIDVTYVSRDMDIVLTLRSSDVRSVLPEATVTLSGVMLSGILRLDAELTPEYPFVGNASVR